MLKKFTNTFKNLNPNIQGFVILIVILVIGIILRWNYIIDNIIRGFKYFSKQ